MAPRTTAKPIECCSRFQIDNIWFKKLNNKLYISPSGWTIEKYRLVLPSDWSNIECIKNCLVDHSQLQNIFNVSVFIRSTEKQIVLLMEVGGFSKKTQNL